MNCFCQWKRNFLWLTFNLKSDENEHNKRFSRSNEHPQSVFMSAFSFHAESVLALLNIKEPLNYAAGDDVGVHIFIFAARSNDELQTPPDARSFKAAHLIELFKFCRIIPHHVINSQHAASLAFTRTRSSQSIISSFTSSNVTSWLLHSETYNVRN